MVFPSPKPQTIAVSLGSAAAPRSPFFRGESQWQSPLTA
jgi:hypothetical protein